MQRLNAKKKLLDSETKKLSFVRTEPRTPQIENEDPCADIIALQNISDDM